MIGGESPNWIWPLIYDAFNLFSGFQVRYKQKERETVSAKLGVDSPTYYFDILILIYFGILFR